ncbi:MAG: bifunctional UDP-N-acetylmuramoyl-tripeptide:D-alanyl-D-alanine ligase/alanine racemase [Bacteroidota bacterium]
MYSPKQIAHAINGYLTGHTGNDLSINYLLTDSRRLLFPDKTVFFALVTPKNNGHKYIADLIFKGVKCFVVSEMPVESHLHKHVSFINVQNTLLALQKLAAWHRKKFQNHIIGITGSNGKTIVKEWLTQLLSTDHYVVKNPRSYNSQTGVPLSVWQITSAHDLGIFEAGISLPNEMERLKKIIEPNFGIFTNIGPAHDEGFLNRRAKIREKLKLFTDVKWFIYRNDHGLLHDEICRWKQYHPNVKTYEWGTTTGSFMQIKETKQNCVGYETQVFVQGKGEMFFTIPFFDHASFENAMHCIIFLILKGYSAAEIQKRVLNLQPVSMRLEMLQGINDCSIINDVYNSDLLSLSVALDFMENQVKQKKKVVILSDILQTGMQSKNLYNEVAGLLKAHHIDKFFAIGQNLQKDASCFTGIETFHYKSTDDFIARFDSALFRNQGILVKGARDFGFEKIIDLLQQKDHQTLLEINLDALINNLNVYKNLLKNDTRIMCMVKAFSYGSGSYEIARVLQYHRVDYLAVAFADEGKELRNAGITLPILVLNPELSNLEILFRYHLEPEIYSLPLLKRIAQFAADRQSFGEPFPIHIKVDTGMHRLGFLPEEIPQLLQMLADHPQIKVASVFSHFAASDQEQFDHFTQYQFNLFDTICKTIADHLKYKFLKHIANTSAITRFPEMQLDMVRLGIGLYGVDRNEKMRKMLQTVMTFRSVVSQIKTVKAGETVGYNRSGKTIKDTKIAIVPLGYADGLRRNMLNGYLLVNGQKAPFLGNISMDMCTLDVSGLDVKEGDKVEVFGKQLPVEQIAKIMHTIPYEVYTSVASRVKRLYYSE